MQQGKRNWVSGVSEKPFNCDSCSPFGVNDRASKETSPSGSFDLCASFANVGFGSRSDSLFGRLQKYSDESKKFAVAVLNTWQVWQSGFDIGIGAAASVELMRGIAERMK
jgi:hypothetical protein